jgi:RNA polymerase sigma-70 factor (ECF subfamily)
LDDAELERLVSAARYHDMEAIASLYEEFYPRVYRFMLHRGERREDAEDLASEVCLRILSSLSKQSGFFPAWVFRIAENLLSDVRRHSQHVREVELSDTIAGAFAVPGWPESLLSQQIDQAMRKLTPDQRDVVYLRFVEGYDAGEIGRIQGRSEGAVRALQFRALEVLRGELGVRDGGGYEV